MVYNSVDGINNDIPFCMEDGSLDNTALWISNCILFGVNDGANDGSAFSVVLCAKDFELEMM